MKEKIYCIHDEWDGLILKGTADFNGEKFYFSNIFDKISDDFSEVYELTKLNQYIFNLEVENWEYWKFWLTSLKQYNGFEEQAKYIANGCVGHPHPVNYADFRKTQSFAEIEEKCIFSNKDNLNKAEKYYQNKLIFEQYLKNNKPLIVAKGVFFRNEVDSRVIWTVIEKPKTSASY